MPSIYLSNNSSFDKHIPLHIQRNYIVDYCKNNNIQYSGYVFENEHLRASTHTRRSDSK